MGFDDGLNSLQGDPKNVESELGKQILGSVSLRPGEARKINLGTGNASVVVIPSPLRGQGFILQGREAYSLTDKLTLGKTGTGNSLEFDDPAVTPQQATISLTSDGWRVREDSPNPTFIAELPTIKPGEKRTTLPDRKWIEVDAQNNVKMHFGSRRVGAGVNGSIRHTSNGINLTVDNQSYPLSHGTFIKIGREFRRGGNLNTVNIDDPRISGEHGAILLFAGKLYFYDKSTNGTEIEVIDPTGQVKPYSELRNVGRGLASLAGKTVSLLSSRSRPSISTEQVTIPPSPEQIRVPVQRYTGGSCEKNAGYNKPNTAEKALTFIKGSGLFAVESHGNSIEEFNVSSNQALIKKALTQLNSLYAQAEISINDVMEAFEVIAEEGRNGMTPNSETSIAMAQPVGDKLVCATAGTAGVYIVEQSGAIRLVAPSRFIRNPQPLSMGISNISVDQITLSPNDRFVITVPDNTPSALLTSMNEHTRRATLYGLAHSRDANPPPLDRSLLADTTLAVIDLGSKIN